MYLSTSFSFSSIYFLKFMLNIFEAVPNLDSYLKNINYLYSKPTYSNLKYISNSKKL